MSCRSANHRPLCHFILLLALSIAIGAGFVVAAAASAWDLDFGREICDAALHEIALRRAELAERQSAPARPPTTRAVEEPAILAGQAQLDREQEALQTRRAGLRSYAGVLLVAAPVPLILVVAAFVRQEWRTRRTLHRLWFGRCVRCGCDLRGAAGRCPQCGEAVPAAVSQSAAGAADSSGDTQDGQTCENSR
jgi:hypothetical protein